MSRNTGAKVMLAVFGGLLMLGGGCFVILAGSSVRSDFTWQKTLLLLIAVSVTVFGVFLISRSAKK